MYKFLDTSKAIASGTLNFDYVPVVNSYTAEEMARHGIDTSSTICVWSPSWPDFQHINTEGKVETYQWQELTTSKTLLIYHYNRSFGKKAPCGCDATVQIIDADKVYYCCESVANRNADFATITGTILHPEIELVDTRDKCLGQNCKFIHDVICLIQRDNNSTS